MILALVGMALAAPDRLAVTWPVGTDVTDIVATEDGAFVGWVEASGGSLTVLDTGTFDPYVLTACTGARGLAVTGSAESGYTFYVGCADGTAAQVNVTADGDATKSETFLPLGEDPVQGLETDGTTLFAILGTEESLYSAAVTLEGGAAVDGFGTTLASSTFEDTTLTVDSLIVVHGGDEVSKINKSSGTTILPQSSLGRTLVDAYPYAAGNAVYLADEGGGLVRFESDNDYMAVLTGIDSTTAVGINATDGWAVLGAGENALLYDFDGGTFTEAGTIEGAANLREIATIPGYAFGASEDGSVDILTDRPWVTVESLSAGSAVSGDEITITFESDIGGTYSVHVGGTVDDPGPELGTGGEIADGGTAEVTFTVNDDFAEGANRIWVFVEDDNGNVGRVAGSLSVDNPPEAVTLGVAGVGFGNQSIHVEFDGLTAEDIIGYVIFIDVNPFVAADYPTGGPGFTGTDDIVAPIVVTAGPGEHVSRTISPLTNGTTYYVAVRAYDAGKLEGPMSDVQSTMPEETFCASCLRGDDSGFFPGLCGVTGGGSAGVVGVVLAGAALLRRRRVAAATVGLLALGLAPGRAEAAEDDDEGPRTMNVQLRYGPTTIAEPYIQQIYAANPHEMLWFEYGWASRFVEANLGIGFFQELGFLQTADGRVSDEHDMFTIVPLALTVTGRLDLLEEQPIVPFGRVGVDYWLWRENWYVADAATMVDERVGGKYGWHYGGGLALRLDVLDRKAASRLEATAGINDTFLVAEYRKTNLVHAADQVNLSSSEFTFGLKFDF